MFRLLSILGAAMFLTLLIGGRDNGQLRLGLVADKPTTRIAAQPLTDAKTPLAKPLPQPEMVSLAAFSADTSADQPAAQPAVSNALAGAALVEPAKQLPVAKESQVTAQVATETQPEIAPELPILFVNSNAINVRQGPSTRNSVIGRLTRHEAVSVVEAESNGWVRIRMEGDGIEGYVAARLLTQIDPDAN